MVAEQVRAGRTRKQWTRGRLADEAQATHAEITAIEMSAADAPPDLLGRIAAALGVRIEGSAEPARPRRSTTPPSRDHIDQEAEGTKMPDTPTPAPAPAPDQTKAQETAPPDAPIIPVPVAPHAEQARVGAGVAPAPTPAPVEVVKRGRKSHARTEGTAPPSDNHASSTGVALPERDRENQIVALLERVAGGHFFYQDGRAWLLRDDDALVAESRLLAAYALLTDALLSGGTALDDDERDEALRLHRSLFDAPAARETNRRGRGHR